MRYVMILVLFLGVIGDPRSCPAPAPASQPASAPAPTDEMADLCRTVLADPLDAAAMVRLVELRLLEQRNRRAAFDALIQALQSSLEGNRAAAHMAILKVREVPEVEKLAESMLGISLNDLAKSRNAEEPFTLCRSCGDTGLADCSHCRGTGIVNCSTCKGRGVLRGREAGRDPADRSLTIAPCPDCNAGGAMVCTHCAGRGTVPCRTCSRESDPRPGAALFDEPMLGNIRKLIAQARYLRDGGIDLFSPDALTCAPRMVR